jgi:hypothetical protein
MPPAAAAASSPDAGVRAEIDALREEVHALRARVDEEKGAPRPAASGPGLPSPSPPRPLGYEAFWPWVLPPDGISSGAYLQAQYDWVQNSQDQLTQSGALLNKDRFLIRRGRASLVGEWEYVAVALELDANTTNGPQVDLRKAEASLQYRPDRTKPPIIMATLGQFDTPFGYELVESPRTRWFMERSTASQAFWPGEPDLGVRFAGALAFFRWTVSAVNGEPIGELSPYQLQDPNSAKDVIFRFGFDTKPRDDLQLAGGVSSLRGRGFDPGSPATKSSIQYSDLSGTNTVTIPDLTGEKAQLGKPAQNFDRWTAGADLRMNFRWWPGVLKIYGEFMLGQNMDRGQYFADPILTAIDQRELGFYVGGLQEICRYGMVGVRYDYYDPNSNAFDNRYGRPIPYSQAIQTTSILGGLTLPDRARLVLQYDIVRNHLARDAIGLPKNLPSNAFTVRLQVQL